MWFTPTLGHIQYRGCITIVDIFDCWEEAFCGMQVEGNHRKTSRAGCSRNSGKKYLRVYKRKGKSQTLLPKAGLCEASDSEGWAVGIRERVCKTHKCNITQLMRTLAKHIISIGNEIVSDHLKEPIRREQVELHPNTDAHQNEISSWSLFLSQITSKLKSDKQSKLKLFFKVITSSNLNKEHAQFYQVSITGKQVITVIKIIKYTCTKNMGKGSKNQGPSSDGASSTSSCSTSETLRNVKRAILSPTESIQVEKTLK